MWRILILALVLGAGVLVLWLPFGPGPSSSPEPGAGEAGHAESSEPPLLKTDWAIALRARAAARRHDAVQVQPASAATHGRIHGTVRSDAGPVAGADVFVLELDEAGDPSGVPLAASHTRVDGSFSMALASPQPPDGRDVHVGVLPSGYARLGQDVRVSAGEESAVHFYVERGESIAGRVVDAAGRPVGGLRLVATNLPGAYLNADLAVLGPPADRLEALVRPAGLPYHRSFAASTDDGGFTFLGLGPGTYTIIADSNEWFLRGQGGYGADASGVELTADRALSLSARVTSEQGALVPFWYAKAEVSLNQGPAYTLAAGGQDESEIHLAWAPRGGEHTTGFQLRLRVTSPGYFPALTQLAVPPGESVVATSVVLRPLRGVRAVFDVLDAEGRDCAADLVLDLLRYPEKNAFIDNVALNREAPGRYSTALPPGRWFVSLHPAHELGSEVAWLGEISVPEERSTSTRCALPAAGVVEITIPEAPGVVWVGSEDQSVLAPLQFLSSRRTIALFPTGAWRFSVSTASGGPQSRSVVVAAERHAEVAFTN